MDPNETLARLLRAAEAFRKLADSEDDSPDAIDKLETASVELANDMAEAAGALDRWLSKGGFLPDRWKRPEKPLKRSPRKIERQRLEDLAASLPKLTERAAAQKLIAALDSELAQRTSTKP